jgi:hypothetical protein
MLYYVKFLSDDTAVSPVIGFALVLAIIVSTMGYMQTHFVPVWNAEAESENFENVYQDMVLFSSNLESAAVSGIPRTSPIRLGFNYPTRGIFYNPKTALFGVLEVKPDVYVNITYTTVFNVTTKSYRSSTLKYELPGNHPYLVYEHGIVIRDFSKFGVGNATGSPNTLIVGDNINIPLLIISGSGFSTVSVQPTIASIYPIALTEKKNFVEYLRYVNITMDTHYPEVWKHILRFANTSKTNATVIGNKVYINTTAGNEINLPDETKQVTQAGRFYGGMALVKTTATLESYKGVGVESMSYGSVWNDVPPPSEVSQFLLTNITIDPNEKGGYSTKSDIIVFKVVDTVGKFWFVTINFDTNTQDQIDSIEGRTFYGSWTNDTNIPVTNATRIDLLNIFGGNGGYNVSNISTPNSLISTYMGDKTGPDPAKSPLIYYKLIIQ